MDSAIEISIWMLDELIDVLDVIVFSTLRSSWGHENNRNLITSSFLHI